MIVKWCGLVICNGCVSLDIAYIVALSVALNVAYPTDVHAVEPCCHVLSYVDAKVYWTVRMKQQWKTHPTMMTTTYSVRHLLTSISIMFIELRQHVYVLINYH